MPTLSPADLLAVQNFLQGKNAPPIPATTVPTADEEALVDPGSVGDKQMHDYQESLAQSHGTVGFLPSEDKIKSELVAKSNADLMRPVVAAKLAAQGSAETAGFSSPQAQAEAARRLETIKATEPLDIEKAKTAGALALADRNAANFQALKGLTEPVLPKAPQGDAGQAPTAAPQATPQTPSPSTASRWKSSVSLSPTGLTMNTAQVLPPLHVPNTQERAIQTVVDEATGLGDKVLQQLRTLHPDIQTNPDKYSSHVSDTVNNYTGGALYRFGNPGNVANTSLQQDIAATKLAISRALTGGQARTSPALLKMVQDVTPDIMYSDGENFKRIREAITKVLPLIVAQTATPPVTAPPEDTSSDTPAIAEP